jgi:predicted nucleic acid-binding Zn ribbon protein
MPTYQFRCPDGTIIERVFKISEVPATVPAPDGSGDAVRMISGGAGLIFKGSGFYITDYGKDGKKDQRDATAKAESKSETKSESKPAGDTAASSSTPAAKSDSGGGSSSSSGGTSGGSTST